MTGAIGANTGYGTGGRSGLVLHPSSCTVSICPSATVRLYSPVRRDGMIADPCSGSIAGLAKAVVSLRLPDGDHGEFGNRVASGHGRSLRERPPAAG